MNPEVSPGSEELAARAFARRRFGPWSDGDESEFKTRVEQDMGFADAYRRVEQSWAAVGQHATSAEVMSLREKALARARRATANRWMENTVGRRHLLQIAASMAAAGIVLAASYQFAPFGFRPGEYRTDVGEQRSIELADHSRIALDAATRLRVRFSKESRVVQLLQGQAQFTVAKDSSRPFKVEAGEHTVVAVGTVFTVEYVDREMQVAMLEGAVAVLSPDLPHAAVNLSSGSVERRKSWSGKREVFQGRDSRAIEEVRLSAGEGLRVTDAGQAIIASEADLEAATAWRKDKVIFHSERLGQAVRRLNRYSRLQLQVDDPKLASMNISGVFDAGDTAAFVEAVESYLPATSEHIDAETIRIRMK